MIPILTILSFAVLILRDSGATGAGPPLMPWLHEVEIVLLTLAPLTLIAGAVDVAVRLFMLRLDRTGDRAAVTWIDRVVAAGRWIAILWYAVAVLGLGWLDVVRAWLPPGGGIVLDEGLAAMPMLAVIVAGWWSSFPLERRMHEALIMRRLDEGRPFHPLPTRGGYVLMQVRHQMLLTLVPMLALTAWSHGVAWTLSALRATPSYAAILDRWSPEALRAVGQLVGLVTVFALMPLVLRVVWRTTPLRQGPMRKALGTMCARHRVGVRELLVWHTGGTMLNGAVVGLASPLRYVLVTDALLENLPSEQVEAVLAHEVGHAHHHHAPWLAASLLAALAAASLATDAAARALAPTFPGPWSFAIVQIVLATLGMALALGVFGWISRRFEWQADAFAAAHLSPASGPVTGEAVAAMTGALETVARLNGMTTEKFSWRHGSIDRRVRLLQRLQGASDDRFVQNRVAKAIKLAVALTITGLVVLMNYQ